MSQKLSPEYSRELFASIQLVSGEMVQSHLEKEFPKIIDELYEKQFEEQKKENHQNDIIGEDNNISSFHSRLNLSICPSLKQKRHINESDIIEIKSTKNNSLSNRNYYTNKSKFNKIKERPVSVVINPSLKRHKAKKRIIKKAHKVYDQEEKNSLEINKPDIFDEIYTSDKSHKENDFSLKMFKEAKQIEEKKEFKYKQKKEKEEAMHKMLCTFTPNINTNSRLIMNDSSKNGQPLYLRAIQTYSMINTKKLISIQAKEHQKLESDCKYMIVQNKKMAKADINAFIMKQFEWKKKIDIQKKSKEIALELEEKSMSKRVIDKHCKNEQNKSLLSKSISTSYTSLQSRLHLENERRMLRKRELAKTLEPSFKPIVNSPRSTINVNKHHKLNRSQSHNQMFNSYAYISNNVNFSSRSQHKFNLNLNESQYQTDRSTIRFPKKKSLKSGTIGRNIKSFPIANNYHLTAVFAQKNKPININWEFEANSTGFNSNNMNKKKDNKYKTNDINTNQDSIISNINNEEPSWYDELEKATSYPGRASIDTNDKDLLTHKLYKLNTANFSSNAMCSSQTFIATKGVFDNLFKSN